MSKRTEGFAVCPRCKGRGTHVNPNVDGHGITAEEMDDLGDDFRADYLAGVYDIRCERCNGDRVVPACGVMAGTVATLATVCGEPVVEGEFVEDVPDPEHAGSFLVVERPFSACYEHLDADERESYDDNADVDAMMAAERRAGA